MSQAKVGRRPQKEYRSREYLSKEEVEKMMSKARKVSRYPERDECLIATMYYHGLRVGEAVKLKWDQIDFYRNILHVSRAKGGVDSTHPIPPIERKLLYKLNQINDYEYIFIGERKEPMSTRNAYRIITNIGKRIKLGFTIHPHMLRHGCGYYLADRDTNLRVIQSYLGHSNIANTTIYTQLSSNKFKGLWQ